MPGLNTTVSLVLWGFFLCRLTTFTFLKWIVIDNLNLTCTYRGTWGHGTRGPLSSCALATSLQKTGDIRLLFQLFFKPCNYLKRSWVGLFWKHIYRYQTLKGANLPSSYYTASYLCWFGHHGILFCLAPALFCFLDIPAWKCKWNTNPCLNPISRNTNLCWSFHLFIIQIWLPVATLPWMEDTTKNCEI